MGKGIIEGLAHIGIFVKDTTTSLDFYKRLGFTLDNEESIDNLKLSFLSAGTCLIELVEFENGENSGRPAGVVDHIAIVVDDIEAAVANAIKNGIEIDSSAIASIPVLGGIKNVFFEGPDGERLEYMEYCK